MAPNENVTRCNRNHILVADDEKNIRELFKMLIKTKLGEQYRIDVAVNGAEAVQAFRDAQHAVIVLDLRMPIMNGEQAFYEIKNLCEAENMEVPSFIFCTGYEPSRRLEKIVSADPAHSLLYKPIDGSSLVNEIRKHLEKE